MLLNEVEFLKSQVTTLKAEALERKAEEEANMNEKLKDYNIMHR